MFNKKVASGALKSWMANGGNSDAASMFARLGAPGRRTRFNISPGGQSIGAYGNNVQSAISRGKRRTALGAAGAAGVVGMRGRSSGANGVAPHSTGGTSGIYRY